MPKYRELAPRVARTERTRGNAVRCLVVLAFFAAAPAVSRTAQEGFRLSLDGQWLFRPDPTRSGVEEGWQAPGIDRSTWAPVITPSYWESYPGMASYDGWGWFARRVQLTRPEGPVTLYCAGVDDEAVVWLNGRLVGSHSGFSDPFAVEIGPALRNGDNWIVILVKDTEGGGGIYRPVTLVDTPHLEDLIRGPYSRMRPRMSPDWVRDAVIYSVYLRSFSPDGTFEGLERRVPELKALGATVLWLLPIHPVGLERRKGTLGSPYAVRDYYAVNPEFGTMDDFRRLVDTVHAHGMKLIIDLVANHTAWDNPLVTEHPDWYTRDSTGEILPPNPDWYDVADLDYSKPGLRAWMKNMMVWWVKEIGIDGFRCDVSELVPTDFWEEARAALDSVKTVLMLSEGSLPAHHIFAFDITYSWNLYDALGPLVKGVRPVGVLDEILRNEELQFPPGSLRMRFVTNHDKNFWDQPAVSRYGPDGLSLATVLVATFPGIPMIYTGEEVANDRRLSLFEKVDVDWSRPGIMGGFWRRLLALRREHAALRRGTMTRLEVSPEEIGYAFLRTEGADSVLVVMNWAQAERALTVTLPGGSASDRTNVRSVVDILTGKRIPVVRNVVRMSLGPQRAAVMVLGGT